MFCFAGLPALPQFSYNGLSSGDQFTAVQGGPLSPHSRLSHRLTHTKRQKGTYNVIIVHQSIIGTQGVWCPTLVYNRHTRCMVSSIGLSKGLKADCSLTTQCKRNNTLVLGLWCWIESTTGPYPWQCAVI